MGNITVREVITITVDYCNKAHDKTHKTFDFISVNLCPNKPSHKLATDHLQLSEGDLTFIKQILEFISGALGLIVTPFQMINDKKFSIHVYESASVFTTRDEHNINNNNVSTCDKIIIYIAQNRNKVTEPVAKQLTKTVNIHNIEYDVPVNLWYTFTIDNDHKVYAYIHTSTACDYKGALIAVDNKNATNLSLMKEKAIEHYNHTLGTAKFSTDKKTDFI